MLQSLTRFMAWRDSDEGATAVEYGLIVALIAVAVIGAVTLLGGNIAAIFNTAAGKIQ